MKYLLWSVVLYCAWLFWKRQRQQAAVPESAPEVKRAVENMRTCAYCGVNFPESDGCVAAGQDFCCAAHRDQRKPS